MQDIQSLIIMVNLHFTHLPSGVFYGHTTSIIGNGVALDIPVLFNEIQSIVDRGVPKPKILVSDRAQMVMPYHMIV